VKMNKTGKLLAIPLMISLTLTNALSAETPEQQLQRCDAALYAKVKEADLCNLGVQLRTDEMARLGTENARLRESNQAWHKNPFVWAAIGVIFGAYAGARATR
jgi:hypothetical protein